jgi:transposase
MAQRKRYSKQFKEEALRLVSEEGMSLTQVAQDLGKNESMLRRWRKEANRDGSKAFRSQGLARDEELARLKRELGRIKRERDFLRDAAAYFAKESKRGFSA